MSVRPGLTMSEFLTALHEQLQQTAAIPAFSELGNNLTIAPEDYREHALRSQLAASKEHRAWADFVAAFGADIPNQDNPSIIQDTAIRTMSGTGHQHFLGVMTTLIRETTKEKLREALFDVWSYSDPMQNQNLRWDPQDDVRYALRWRNPSGDPVRRNAGSVVGANRLAIEGLPLLSTTCTARGLTTTGFVGRRSTDTFWTWPIWDGWLTLSTARSVLLLPEIQMDSPSRDDLALRGIVEVFRSQRLTVNKFRNFSPAKSV
ncbi:MAG: hypothetical protein KDA84_26590 [Planctomycetaceae bacterium]|nr:hypothetical protein [Planctomycetaceae bacterium]